MWEDPIVAEVHRTREQLASQCGYDVKAFFAELRKRQAALRDRLVPQVKPTEPSFGERFSQFKGAPRVIS
jgi:hypothetical protein